MRRHQPTEEEKIAVKIAKMIDSATLDLDRVGIEIARLRPMTHYNRLVIIAESAVEETENINGRQHDRLF